MYAEDNLALRAPWFSLLGKATHQLCWWVLAYNDHFGSLKIGPTIPLVNEKMIMVHEEHLESARQLIEEFLANTEPETQGASFEYAFFDKIRLIVEFLLFGWIMPGRKHRKKTGKE